MKTKRFYCGDIYKVCLSVRDSGLSACFVPVCLLLSLFCEKRQKKEGRSESVTERQREKEKRGEGRRVRHTQACQQECRLFSEGAENSKIVYLST